MVNCLSLWGSAMFGADAVEESLGYVGSALGPALSHPRVVAVEPPSTVVGGGGGGAPSYHPPRGYRAPLPTCTQRVQAYVQLGADGQTKYVPPRARGDQMARPQTLEANGAGAFVPGVPQSFTACHRAEVCPPRNRGALHDRVINCQGLALHLFRSLHVETPKTARHNLDRCTWTSLWVKHTRGAWCPRI